MAHLQKFTRATLGHMLAHYDRGAKNIGNENLDRSRSHLNYNLAEHQKLPQGEFIKNRCAEVYCQNRKDVNLMCTWVVTVPKELPEKEYKDFFQSTYDFMAKRYGKENIVSAYVHNDEKTPHLHFAFVPVTYDDKKGRFKVSAKEVINRYELQRFHNDLQEHLERELGHTVNVLNEATKEGNKSIEELKRGTAQEELEALRRQILTEKEIRTVKIKKSLFKANKAVIKGTPEELGALKATAAKVENSDKELARAKKMQHEAEQAKKEAIVYADKAEREFNHKKDMLMYADNNNIKLLNKKIAKLEKFKEYALSKHPNLAKEFQEREKWHNYER